MSRCYKKGVKYFLQFGSIWAVDDLVKLPMYHLSVRNAKTEDLLLHSKPTCVARVTALRVPRAAHCRLLGVRCEADQQLLQLLSSSPGHFKKVD